jgi:thiamine biosynthesis lipoprotein
MKRRLTWQIPFLLALIIGTVWIIRQQQSMPYQHDEGFIFGTVYHVTYQSDKDLQPAIEAELQKVDDALSMFNNRSTIARINRGESPDLSDVPMFTDVFKLAEETSRETGGAFDITVAPLVNEWGFGFKRGVPPTKQVIDSLRQLVNYQHVQLVEHNGALYIRKTNPHIMLDCSAIAKGYGSDVVARFFRKNDIQNFMIEIGGEIVTSGLNDKHAPWKIGITKPRNDSLNINQDIQTILNVTDKAMATSGNYRNFYYKNGKKYAHTIDPKTGYPVQHNILSSTVLSNSCAKADAYATAFMVLGLDKAKGILDRHPDLMAYFIYADKNGKNQVWYSPNLKKEIAK